MIRKGTPILGKYHMVWIQETSPTASGDPRHPDTSFVAAEPLVGAFRLWSPEKT